MNLDAMFTQLWNGECWQNFQNLGAVRAGNGDNGHFSEAQRTVILKVLGVAAAVFTLVCLPASAAPIFAVLAGIVAFAYCTYTDPVGDVARAAQGALHRFANFLGRR